MSMLNEVDSSPDIPVIEAAAERLALQEIGKHKFQDTERMGSFQQGYLLGFREGAEFIRSFHRHRAVRDFLSSADKEHKSLRDAPQENYSPQIKPIAGTREPTLVPNQQASPEEQRAMDELFTCGGSARR